MGELLCSDFLTYLREAKVIEPIDDKNIVIEEPRQANLENALREATKKIREKPAILTLIKENGNDNVRLDVTSKSQWNIYDYYYQVKRSLEIQDLDPDSVNEIQIEVINEKELKRLYEHCGKHLCAAKQTKTPGKDRSKVRHF